MLELKYFLVSVRGSLFPANALLKPRTGTEPKLADFLRSIIAQFGTLTVD